MNDKKSLTDSTFSLYHKIKRVSWQFFYLIFFKFSPIPFFKYRSLVLRLFGANVNIYARIYPSAKIWLPSNLVIGAYSTIGPDVNVYNQGKITIGDQVIISQGAHLCASTHDYNDPLHPLVLRPIMIESYAWVCADAFLGPGVNVAEGTVVGARAALFRDSEAWSVYSGNPAVLIKKREIFRNG